MRAAQRAAMDPVRIPRQNSPRRTQPPPFHVSSHLCDYERGPFDSKRSRKLGTKISQRCSIKVGAIESARAATAAKHSARHRDTMRRPHQQLQALTCSTLIVLACCLHAGLAANGVNRTGRALQQACILLRHELPQSGLPLPAPLFASTARAARAKTTYLCRVEFARHVKFQR